MSDSSRRNARAKGQSTADVLRADRCEAPPPLLEERYEFLGDEDISIDRYISREYFEREIEALWPRAWQWACREEHLQEVGDTHVYDIGPYSVIVVRSSADTIEAFLNSCTHRGTRILSAEGGGFSESFTCPFHGWCWNLDGSIKNIPARWDFPHVTEKTHGLQRVQCETWGGFVFINMDPEAGPLAESLDVLPDHFAHFPLDRRRIAVHVEKRLPANWKAAQEAFMEAYHNVETHDSPNGANAQYDVFGRFVTRFIHNIGSYDAKALEDYGTSKWIDPPLTEEQQLRSMAVGGPDQIVIPEGETARRTAAEVLRKSVGERLGIDLAGWSDSLMVDSIEYHLFPNMFLFPGIMIPMVYRFRPAGDDVDSSIFDLLILEPLPEGVPHPYPPEPVRLDVDQSYTEVDALGWLGRVYDQDTGNLRAQQQGFKTSRKPGITLGNYQEARIRRLQKTIDEFVNG
jgi:phenylpropionate dioxygenase-like ring-hydroxylating dioxygenase large terminal subunit